MGSLRLFKQKGCLMLSSGQGHHIGFLAVHGILNIFVPAVANWHLSSVALISWEAHVVGDSREVVDGRWLSR